MVLVNLYATVRELPELDFPHALRNRRDRSDPELEPHLHGFMGYVMQGGERQMTASLFHVLQHIERVSNQVALELEEDAFDAMANWAIAANAILFLPDGTVRDPVGHVLVDPQTGEAEDEAQVPYPPDAIARKQRFDATHAQMGIPVAPGLPPVVGDNEVCLRSADDVLHRACSLLACAIRAESLGSGTPIPTQDLRARLPEAFVAPSPSEQAFLSNDAPEQQAVVNHAWRYECAWVMEWALGLVDALPFPTAICDVPRTARVLVEADRQALLRDATLRPTEQILDALDQHFRLHWAVREARRTGNPPPGNLEPGVLAERHYALNWLVRFQGVDWDEVDTPT